LLAVRIPTAKPRFLTNQRFATVAARPPAVTPEPSPTSTPQVMNNCHFASMKPDSATAQDRIDSAIRIVRFRPSVCMNAAPNGPISPYRPIFTDTAAEIVVRSQPKAFCNGTISTLGEARTPAVASITRNMVPSTIQE
jgi:hypothetical protein